MKNLFAVCLFLSLLIVSARWGGELPNFLVDVVTRATVYQRFDNYQIHQGNRYKVNYPIELGDGEYAELLITTPDTLRWAHMIFVIQSDLAGRAKLYEGTTKTGGTEIPIYNRNRNNVNPSVLVVTHTPTGVGDGTLGPDEYFGGGKFGGGQGIESQSFIILKQNTKYLLRVTSEAAINRINISLWWNEYTHA